MAGRPPRVMAAALVPAGAQSPVANKAQQAFNRLIEKIQRQRQALAEWQAFDQQQRQRVQTEMLPLMQQQQVLLRQQLLLSEQWLTRPVPRRGPGALSASLRRKLISLVLQLAENLLSAGPDAEVEAVFDRYSAVSAQEMRDADMVITEAMLSQVFGVELDGDHGAATPEDLIMQVAAQAQAQAAAEAERQQARREARKSKAAQRAASSAGGAKPDAAATRQSRREQAALEVSQSVRAIYRQLVSALHPDREPDEAQRVRKTEMMQRVNTAYEARDLLSLLSLQLEIEQIDIGHLGQIPPERLKHYNQVLKEQSNELAVELNDLMQPFLQMLESSDPWGEQRQITPAMVCAAFDEDLASLRRAVADLERDLQDFQDPAKLREWLKHWHPTPPAEPPVDLLDELFSGDFDFDEPVAAPPGRKRRKQPF